MFSLAKVLFGSISRRTFAALTLPLLLLCSLSVSPLIVLAQDGPVRNAPDSAIQPPEVTARAVYAYDMTSDVELYAFNADDRLPIASTVKIATALVVIEHADLDEEVTIEEDDLVDATQSNMGVNGLSAGDTLTVEQLLNGLLVPSGNDAANTLARYVGMKLADPSDPESGLNIFVDAMNALAADLGLENTRFTNPVGLDSTNSYSSAHDLAHLAAQLMRDDTLREIVGKPSMSLTSVGPEQRVYEESGTNQMLGEFGVVGVKTGSTEDAGACFVSARSKNDGDNTVITVVLGSELAYGDNSVITVDERWDDTERTFNAMDETFRWVGPDEDGVMPGLDEQLDVWGVAMDEPPAIPVPNNPDVAIRFQLVLAQPGEDQPAGRVLLYFGEDEVGSLPVYAVEASISEPAAA